ncbi:MAG: riboflavin synthase [Candidatus Omnitrophota bacterium]
MFTGIIEELGIVVNLSKSAGFAVLSLKAKEILAYAKKGDSVSVNGICLTITDKASNVLKFDVSAETLKRTNIASLRSSDKVNLERALKADSRFGGHFVSGHVDFTSKIKRKELIQKTVKIEFQIQPDAARYIVPKGSIAVDGISLTVGEVLKNSFDVYAIPYTLENTTLGFKKENDVVNIEVDMLAKYAEKLLSAKDTSNVTKDLLSECGFI